jgi:SSS family solute:Na+ symporter
MLDTSILIVFLLALVGIGRWASRRVHSSLDFHLAGRRLGKLPVALSLAATEFNGSGLVGGAGLAYTVGIAGMFWNLSAVPAWIILGFTVAVALRKLSLYTVPEFLGNRYDSRARRLASVSQLLSGIIFLAVQVLVSALAISTMMDVPMIAAALVVTVVFVLYTYGGGLLAVVWTDVICYFVLMAAVVIGFPLALRHAGWVAGLQQALPPERFDLGQLGVIEPLAWVALCFYSYGTDQAYVQRVFAARKVDAARFAYLYTGLNYVVFGGAVAVLGMSAAALLPDLAHHDEALPALIMHIFPPGVRGLFLTGVVAATMSTASSFLAAGSSLFAKDIYQPLLARGASEKHLLTVSRWSTVGIAAVALLIALTAPRVVDAVVLSVLVSHAAVFFPIIAGLYWRRVAPAAGFWAILAGAAGGVVSHFFIYEKATFLGAIHPLFFGPILSILVLVVVTVAARSRPSPGA